MDARRFHFSEPEVKKRGTLDVWLTRLIMYGLILMILVVASTARPRWFGW